MLERLAALSWKHVLPVGAAVGLAVPIGFTATYELSGHRYLFGPETMVLWPSVIFLFGTDGLKHTWGAHILVAEVLLLNVLLYTFAAAAVFGVSRILRRIRARG